MTSDSTLISLMDFERVLDEADLYAFKNWQAGELVDGPDIKKYSVACTFMWPEKLMPNPKGGKRLLALGCKVRFLKTALKMPIKVESPFDFKGGTHYPKMIERPVWLVNIVMPKELMNDVKEGSIDLADQTIDLEDLDEAYAEDLDKSKDKNSGEEQAQSPGALGAPPLGAPPGAPPLGPPPVGGPI
jgi:hypothetical protein